jgi:cobalamin biosynthesis protein CobD/CbiB
MMAVLTLLAVGVCLPALAAIIASSILVLPKYRAKITSLENEVTKLSESVRRQDLESFQRRLTALELRGGR